MPRGPWPAWTRWSWAWTWSSSYGKLAVAAEAVRAGARFVATNRDPVYPLEHGLMPGAGSIVAAVAAASGVEPVSIGKPAPLLLEVAARAAGHSPAEAVMIGDSLVTDIPAARAVGARSVLMLTGISGAAQVAALAPADRPTEVAADAAGLAAALDRLAARPARLTASAARRRAAALRPPPAASAALFRVQRRISRR